VVNFLALAPDKPKWETRGAALSTFDWTDPLHVSRQCWIAWQRRLLGWSSQCFLERACRKTAKLLNGRLSCAAACDQILRCMAFVRRRCCNGCDDACGRVCAAGGYNRFCWFAMAFVGRYSACVGQELGVAQKKDRARKRQRSAPLGLVLRRCACGGATVVYLASR